MLSLLQGPVRGPRLARQRRHVLSIVRGEKLPFIEGTRDSLADDRPSLYPCYLEPVADGRVTSVESRISTILTSRMGGRITRLKNTLLRGERRLSLRPCTDSLHHRASSYQVTCRGYLSVVAQCRELLRRGGYSPFAPISDTSLKLDATLNRLSRDLTGLEGRATT